MNNTTLLGIDIAKNVFQLHGVDALGNTTLTKRLSRKKFAEFMVNFPKTQVVMECCGTSHYWGRVFTEQGHDVKLISAQHVRPYVTGNKNDRNDAAAIVEAAKRVNAKFVPIKTVGQQELQALLRIRQGFVKERLRLSNQIRGLALEFGVFIPKGFLTLKKQLPSYLGDESHELGIMIKEELKQLLDQFETISEKIKAYDRKVSQITTSHAIGQKLLALPGVSPLSALALIALGDVQHLKNGRGLAALLGLVPKQHSSGNQQRLLGISKRGNGYIRELLIHGARAVLSHIGDKTDPKSLWLKSLMARRGTNRAAVALANKHARIIWHILAHGDEYKPELLTTWKALA